MTCRKMQFTSGAEARRFASTSRKPERRRQLWPYHCRECGGYHLTSMTKAEVRALRAQRRERLGLA